MEDLTLQFFPFPHVVHGERRNGALIDWPNRCLDCDHHCEMGSTGEVSLCSYGLNYFKVDEDLLIAGIVLRDFPNETPARRKMYAKLRHQLVSKKEFDRVIELIEEANTDVDEELQRRVQAVITEYRQPSKHQEKIVQLLRPETQQAVAQVHDYKQFVQQIIQNLNVLLEQQFPGLVLAEKLKRARHEETAIYWAAQMMDEKLEAVMFLQQPARISDVKERGTLDLNSSIERYVRIYQRKADQRSVNIIRTGAPDAHIVGNTRALGIIPHTLLDNAIKYAPSGSKVELSLKTEPGQCIFSVSSFGPFIWPSERDRIFNAFYRGRAARRMRVEGTGFGLAAAEAIARAHDTQISVTQSRPRGPEETFWTTFSVTFVDQMPNKQT